jgi:hypothetical protein
MRQDMTTGGQNKGKMALMAETLLMQRREHALEIKILAMSRAIFDQIRTPNITREDYDRRLALAEKYAVGIALQDGTASLLVFDDTGLWRWSLLPADELEVAFEELPWMTTLPRVCLTDEDNDPYTGRRLRGIAKDGQAARDFFGRVIQ